MGKGRGHEHIVPNQAKYAGITPNNPKARGCHSASENPIGIETISTRSGSAIFRCHSASENPIGIETRRLSAAGCL